MEAALALATAAAKPTWLIPSLILFMVVFVLKLTAIYRIVSYFICICYYFMSRVDRRIELVHRMCTVSHGSRMCNERRPRYGITNSVCMYVCMLLYTVYCWFVQVKELCCVILSFVGVALHGSIEHVV